MTTVAEQIKQEEAAKYEAQIAQLSKEKAQVLKQKDQELQILRAQLR